MKTFLFATAFALGLSSMACGVAARSPEMYRDDTAKVLEPKNNDIRACYDGVLKGTPGVQGRVSIKFDVETDQGAITNVTVDKANTTAPDPVAECVTKNIAGLKISPPDARVGNGTFFYDFQAPPPPAPAPISGPPPSMPPGGPGAAPPPGGAAPPMPVTSPAPKM